MCVSGVRVPSNAMAVYVVADSVICVQGAGLVLVGYFRGPAMPVKPGKRC